MNTLNALNPMHSPPMQQDHNSPSCVNPYVDSDPSSQGGVANLVDTNDSSTATLENSNREEFQSILMNTYKIGREVVGKIVQLQMQLKQHESLQMGERAAWTISASHNNPSLVVLSEAVHIIIQEIGRGTQSRVLSAERISARGSPIKAKAIKVNGKTSYEKEAKILPAHLNDPRIDQMEQYCRSVNSDTRLYLAIYEKSDMDLTRIDYSKILNPVSFIISQLISIAGGLNHLHQNNIIHRDVKGANLLVNTRGIGKVTDTGFAIELQPKQWAYKTALTPKYAAPFIWKNLEDQLKHQNGYQGKEADVFALGRTIQYDVIVKIIKELAIKFDIQASVSNCLASMEPRIFECKLDRNVLKELEVKHPNHVIVNCINRKCVGCIYPTRDELKGYSNSAIDMFNNLLNEREMIQLRMLSDVAYNLQDIDPTTICSMEMAENALKEIAGAALRDGFDEVKVEEVENRKDLSELPNTGPLNAPLASPLTGIKRNHGIAFEENKTFAKKKQRQHNL